MTANTRPLLRSVVVFAVALIFGSVAARSVFTPYPQVHFSSARANELFTDLVGIAASIFATIAALTAYPRKKIIWVRIYLTFVILFALAYSFEFLLGFLWFAADHFKTFDQHLRLH